MSERLPFRIRGHHLRNFSLLATNIATPETLAGSIVECIAHNSDFYRSDVLGTTDEAEQLVEQRFTKVFQQFMELRDSDPITLTTGQKDMICESCIVGSHCMDKTIDYVVLRHGLLSYPDDMVSVKKFRELATELVHSGEIELRIGVLESMRNSVLLTEAERTKYEVPITAPAGFVNVVLKHWQ